MRKHRHEEHENHERWLVSYADFITLLFAFFVVMYAISSVNEGKYRVLSDSLEQAFNESPMKSLDPVQVGDHIAMNQADPNRDPNLVNTAAPVELDGPGITGMDTPLGPGELPGTGNAQNEHKSLEEIKEKLMTALDPLIASDQISVNLNKDSVEVSVKSSILFDSGKAEIIKTALPVLNDLAKVLLGFGNPLRVEGFTDNQPIATSVYPSNWELSAARAASVVHQLQKQLVNGERMTAVGYGENRPIAENLTAEGRQLNRRVVVVVSMDPAEQTDEPANAVAPAVIEAAPAVGSTAGTP